MYGHVTATKNLRGSIAYNADGASPHSDNDTKRNIKRWTYGLPSNQRQDATNMEHMLAMFPNKFRKNEAYNYIIGARDDEYDPTNELDIEDFNYYVEEVCDEQFGNNTPYIVAIQKDGESGLLHAHITALNIRMDTGKALEDERNVFNFRNTLDHTTKRIEKENENLKEPLKTGIVIPKQTDVGKKKQPERYRYAKEMQETIDNVLETKQPETFEHFRQALDDEGIEVDVTHIKKDHESDVTGLTYKKPVKNEKTGKTRKRRRSASKMGTSYTYEGVIGRMKEIQQQKEQARQREQRKEVLRKERERKLKQEKKLSIKERTQMVKPKSRDLSTEQVPQHEGEEYYLGSQHESDEYDLGQQDEGQEYQVQQYEQQQEPLYEEREPVEEVERREEEQIAHEPRQEQDEGRQQVQEDSKAKDPEATRKSEDREALKDLFRIEKKHISSAINDKKENKKGRSKDIDFPSF